MNESRVSNVALFACNPGKSDAAIEQMRAALTQRGVNVLKKSFVCQGKGFFGSHPTEADLEAARKFAKECVAEVMGE